MAASTTLAAGFTDPVADAQSIFRICLNAMARPGTIMPTQDELGTLERPPAPLGTNAAAIALCLADFETTLWLDSPLRDAPDVTTYLTFHTGARLTDRTEDADFALISAPLKMPRLSDFKQGTPEFPDRSTTLMIQCDSLHDHDDGTQVMTLRGPGVETVQQFFASPAVPDIVEQLTANRRVFPCGVDLMFASPQGIAAIPRSTQISRET